MKLRYRGNFYNPSDSSSPVHHQPVKLIYRGHEYTYQPQPIAAHLPQGQYDRTVQLIYRGHTIDYMVALSSPPQPRALNWRYAMAARQAA